MQNTIITTLAAATTLLCASLGLTGCSTEAASVGSPAASAPAETVQAAAVAAEPDAAKTAAQGSTPTHYGEPIADLSTQVELASVLSDPEAYANKNVVVSGVVRATCLKMGCWMEIASAQAPGAQDAGKSATDAGADQSCRVTFKDHAFFVPKDSKGAQARVAGIVNLRTVPPDEVAHYEGEGGRFAKKFADGSAQEVHIVASGVELARL